MHYLCLLTKIAQMVVEDDQRREFEINSTRFVNLHTQLPHAAGLQYPYSSNIFLNEMPKYLMTILIYSVKPLNWSGDMQIRSSLDGSVENTGKVQL